MKIYPDSLEVPDLVICPLNRFNRSIFEQYNMSMALRQYVELTYPGLWPHEFQAVSANLSINFSDAKFSRDLSLSLIIIWIN